MDKRIAELILTEDDQGMRRVNYEYAPGEFRSLLITCEDAFMASVLTSEAIDWLLLGERHGG